MNTFDEDVREMYALAFDGLHMIMDTAASMVSDPKKLKWHEGRENDGTEFCYLMYENVRVMEWRHDIYNLKSECVWSRPVIIH